MDQRRLRRIFILLLAAAICLEMTRYAGTISGGRLTLWFLRADFPETVMDSLLERCRTQTGLRVDAVCYEDEQALADALEAGRPDLLFCSQARAAQLHARGGLAALPSALPLPTLLIGTEPAVGSSFFPLGGRLPMMLVNTALTSQRYDTIERLLHPPHGGVLLVTDDVSEILYAQLLSVGWGMRGNPEEDLKDPLYLERYNSLALSVLHGTLIPVEADAAEYVRQGLVPCAVVRSTELAGIGGENLRFQTLPPPEGGSILYPAELFGFALPEGGRAGAAEPFLRWLWSDESAGEAAYAAGLVPVAAARDASGTGGLEGALAEIARSGRLCFTDPNGPFYGNRAACERSLRGALELLL